MKIILNEQGFVDSYALIGGLSGDVFEVNEPEDLVDFERNYGSYYLSDGNALVKSEDKQKELADKKELAGLRSQREKVCFPYINRGSLWYGKLTTKQNEELNAWYQAWLDVTDTKVIPEMPEWLANH